VAYWWWLTWSQKICLCDTDKCNSNRVACHRQVTWSWKITTKLDCGKFALHVTFWSPVEKKEAKRYSKWFLNKGIVTLTAFNKVMYQWWLTWLQKSWLYDINKCNSNRVACHRQVTWSWKITTKLDRGKFALHVTFWSPVKEAKGIVNDSLIRNRNKLFHKFYLTLYLLERRKALLVTLHE